MTRKLGPKCSTSIRDGSVSVRDVPKQGKSIHGTSRPAPVPCFDGLQLKQSRRLGMGRRILDYLRCRELGEIIISSIALLTCETTCISSFLFFCVGICRTILTRIDKANCSSLVPTISFFTSADLSHIYSIPYKLPDDSCRTACLSFSSIIPH